MRDSTVRAGSRSSRVWQLFLAALLCAPLAVAAAERPALRPVSEQEVLAYATGDYDKSSAASFVFGSLQEVPVFVDFVCSDLCPQMTVRIIHLRRSGAACTAAGGVERSVLVPVAIAVLQKSFCFPKILVAHWADYRR
jgi:hypothetical protein